MGLDLRDCRCDAGMVLGDGSVPDNPAWNSRDRDKTCVWLDFVDTHFEPVQESLDNLASPKRVTNITIDSPRLSVQPPENKVAETSVSYPDTTGVEAVVDNTIRTSIIESSTRAVGQNRTVVATASSRTTTAVSVDDSKITIEED